MSSTLKQLSLEKPTRADLDAALEEMKTAHPRTAAILGSTFVEDVTRLSILTKMIDLSNPEANGLFVGDAPLSSFSAKIRLAYALGIIGPKTRHDLDTIREIRNAFAHAKVTIDFDTPAVKNAISGFHFRALSSDWDQLTNQRRFRAVIQALLIYMIGIWTTKTADMKTFSDFDPPKSVASQPSA